MRTLEDRLTDASDDARLQVNQIDTRSATSVRIRQQRSRTLLAAAAVVSMFVAFGATAFVITTETFQNSASEPSASPTTVVPGDVTEGSAESTATTSTVIAAESQLPPGLRGTSLTTAWRENVIETMAAAGYEIADIDVFEKEMDRGLVHATFTTVDGDELVLAFGPWRDGEYSDDPAVLREQFFTEKPGQETAEGLLLISERTNPSHVYLAMDVGKIAISFQPAAIASAVPFDDLGALALDLAPIARQLLEANFIQ
jgi:hypothetical protein